MWLLVVHFAVVFTAIFLLASHLEGAPYLGEREKNTPQRHHAALLIFYSEVINFWFWFVKFAPLFISASRGAAAPSLHSYDSCPSDEVVGGLSFDSEPFRTASGPPSRRVGERERAVAAMAS